MGMHISFVMRHGIPATGGIMKLKALKRSSQKKSDIKRLRREGFIPAVIYGKGKGENIAVASNEYQTLATKVQPGHLPVTVFTLVDENGKERKAIIKDIQYQITTYNVTHLDFEELFDDVKVDIKVPIECVGAADSAGIKLGGVLRQVIRHVKVRCLPKDIPSEFVLDVKELGMRQAKRLGDIAFPKQVVPLLSLNEVAVAIVKR